MNQQTEKYYKDYFFNQIESKYQQDKNYYFENGLLCKDPDWKVDLKLSPADTWINNPEKLAEELHSINQFFWAMWLHNRFILPGMIEAFDRYITHLGYVGKYKSQLVSSRYADELYLVHDLMLVTITPKES